MKRRDALKLLAGSATLPLLGACDADKKEPRGENLIRDENKKAGTRDWMLTHTRIDKASKFRCPWIEGYASQASVRAGESLSLHVSTNPASAFKIDIYRTGYYGGTGGRHMQSLGPFSGKIQPEPEIGKERVRECKWDACATITIPRDWLSGVYVAKLTAELENLQSYIVFIVRDDRRADFILQCSDNTWHAYNRWPSQWSLYDDGQQTWYWGPRVAVSYDRPYGKYCQIFDAPLSTGSGEWFLWEFPLAHWMEEQGYDVTYISNIDTHADPKGLLRAKGFISVGHDEYYSLDMYNNLMAAIQAGVNVAFLSGNTCCGLVEIGPSSDGRPNRVITRLDRFGPKEPGYDSFQSMDKLPRNAPNENLLIGARSTGMVVGGADWICTKPEHWLFKGTGMKAGDCIPGLVGWEWHGDPANIPGLEIVATGTARSGKREGTYTATIYPGPKDNFVFNASTIWWSDGLSAPPGYLHPSAHGASPKGPYPQAQRITKNLFARMKA